MNFSFWPFLCFGLPGRLPRAQKSANASPEKSAEEHRRGQKGAKYCKRALPRKTCKQPGSKQPALRTPNAREAPVRFGSVAVWGWNGSSGSGFRFRRFLFKKVFSVFQYSLTRKNGSGSGFGSWKTVLAVPVPLSVSGKTVPTVPVSGSSSVPEPPCNARADLLAKTKAQN